MSVKKTIILLIPIFLILFFVFNRFTVPPQPSLSSPDQTASALSSDSHFGLVFVSRVIDGDTIVINKNGTDEKIRLIGVNTPETVDPRKKVQCFGYQASEFVKNMLTEKYIRLEQDPTQPDRDKYGRLLRYVYLDKIFVNEEIIQEGYGFEYTYGVPYQYQAEFKASEKYAREGKIGLWAPDACNGKLK